MTSIIIGARRSAQLEDNVQAIDVTLTPEERERLDALTKPTFGFPQSMQPMFPPYTRRNDGQRCLRPTTGFGIEKGDQPY